MITLITGLPGNGKTLFALQWVKNKAEKEGRPVFYAGIKDLKLPWTQIEPEKWPECPARSIVVMDECQRQFGVRGRGAPIPDHARQLETHRHLGIDLVMITQSPMLLDSHDRSLMEQHYHVVRKFGLQRATVHEFSPVRDNALKSRTGSIRHEWRYPKDAFQWYTSAEVHTHKARVPMRVWLLLALPFIFAAVVWFLVSQWMAKIKPEPKPQSQPVNVRQLASGGQARPTMQRAAYTPAEYLDSFTPRVPGLAYTAPAYDQVTKPLQAPYPAACLSSNKRPCRCYTQQGTRLEVPPAMCTAIAAGGFFVAWDRPVVNAIRTSPEPAEAKVEPRATMIGIRGTMDRPTDTAPVAYEGQVDQQPAPRPPSRPGPSPSAR